MPVRHWITAWLHSWEARRFVLSSPLSVEETRRRLAQGGARHLGEFVSGSWMSPGAVSVLSKVTGDRIKLEVRRSFVRNSWQPVLRGRLAPTATGCQLVCRVG